MEEKTNKFSHVPVLLNEVIEGLNIRKDGIYVDGTLGGAGHSSEIYKRLESGMLIGIDQDGEAILAAASHLNKSGAGMVPTEYHNSTGNSSCVYRSKDTENRKVLIFRSNYENVNEVLNAADVEKVDGILLDLGVSSYQLDTPERGFSYNYDAPLDMRMDQRQEKTAYDIVNGYAEMELFKVIAKYGEDRFAKNIAKHICEARNRKPIETTFELNEIIKAAIPARVRATGGHPSKRTFQAIRIELNRELDVLKNTLETMIDRLGNGGRLCVITFHSLEDRIVKNIFNTAEDPCICPPEFPVCVCGKKSKGKHLTKKAILPTEEEKENNSRSKSAKLRIFEKGMI
ncbi:MAG: 16S rRNA (cytosine(1402)-N(4))-methyltransferase RsmH [Lachnospiraceae bacterium]|nr:16S rRNA (cytosine(1402)-N(4))-methyltransferase RsmH [Lachnospiraceae bacterium]